MRKLLFVIAMVLPAAVVAGEEATDLEHWPQQFPDANSSLEQWIREHPKAARDIFFWDRDHPLRARFFVRWVVDHPEGTLDEFVSGHTDWPAVDTILKPQRPAIETFVAWAHAHPAAAKEVAERVRGLHWIGERFFRDLWNLPPEAPR